MVDGWAPGFGYLGGWRFRDFYFWVSAAIPLRIRSLILAARLPSDPSIAAMMSASVRRLSLAVINKVFSRIQALFASLSAIDFYPLLWYIFSTAVGDVSDPPQGQGCHPSASREGGQLMVGEIAASR